MRYPLLHGLRVRIYGGSEAAVEYCHVVLMALLMDGSCVSDPLSISQRGNWRRLVLVAEVSQAVAMLVVAHRTLHRNILRSVRGAHQRPKSVTTQGVDVRIYSPDVGGSNGERCLQLRGI